MQGDWVIGAMPKRTFFFPAPPPFPVFHTSLDEHLVHMLLITVGPKGAGLARHRLKYPKLGQNKSSFFLMELPWGIVILTQS